MNKEYGAAFVPAQTAAESIPSSEIPAAGQKTPLMLSVEQRFAAPGESIGQLLARLYQEDLTFREMSCKFANSELKVSDKTLRGWMRTLNPQIKIKSLAELYQDPQFIQRQISRVRAFWQDPEKKRQTIEKRNENPGYVNRKKPFFDPELRAERHKKIAKTKRKKAYQNRRAALGRTPRKTLKNMTDQGLSVDEIATKIVRSESMVRGWMKEYGIKPGRKPPERRKRPRITDVEIEQKREKIKGAQAADLFKYLTLRQQEALSALYPEQGTVPTQQKVANDLHLTHQRISQLEIKGLAHLDKLLTDGPDAFKRKGHTITLEPLPPN